MMLAATPRELQVASQMVAGELYSLVRLYEEAHGRSTIRSNGRIVGQLVAIRMENHNQN